MIKKQKLVRDEMLPTAEEVLSVQRNPWREESEDNPKLRKVQAETLAALLAFVKRHHANSLNKVTQRLGNPPDFRPTVSELILLYAMHPANSAPKLELVPYTLEYDPGKGSPDIRIDRPSELVIGVEVTRAEVKDIVDHTFDSTNPDYRPVDVRIASPMKKLDAELEEKVGKFGDCDIKVIAIDITDYVQRVFLTSEHTLINYHMESYLYGQAKFLYDRRAEEVQAIRDARELPTVKGEGVEAFFLRRPQISAVIYFWHGFHNSGDWHGCRLVVNCKLASNPSSAEEERFPWDLAFALANVMNEGGPFTVANLRSWGLWIG